MGHHARRVSADKRWGIFRQDAQIDVAPCERGGELAQGHVLGGRCRCKPRVESQLYYAKVFIHDKPITEPSDGNN